MPESCARARTLAGSFTTPTTGETSSSGENMSCMALPMNDHSTKIRSPGSTMDTKAETRLLKNFASAFAQS